MNDNFNEKSNPLEQGPDAMVEQFSEKEMELHAIAEQVPTEEKRKLARSIAGMFNKLTEKWNLVKMKERALEVFLNVQQKSFWEFLSQVPKNRYTTAVAASSLLYIATACQTQRGMEMAAQAGYASPETLAKLDALHAKAGVQAGVRFQAGIFCAEPFRTTREYSIHESNAFGIEAGTFGQTFPPRGNASAHIGYEHRKEEYFEGNAAKQHYQNIVLPELKKRQAEQAAQRKREERKEQGQRSSGSAPAPRGGNSNKKPK